MDTPIMMPVPGSEVFTSRPLPIDELKSRIDPSLRLHEVTDTDIDEIDPLTYEVIRHRIWSITDEMGTTLKKMSGSASVSEANDFDFAICDEVGQEVQVGIFNTILVASMDLAIYWILQHRSGNPGIHPGDMFLTNDPWIGGGVHQNDTAIISPIFWEGELFGWTSSVLHQIDVGGAKPGSADLAAQDVFTEGVPTPPIKIVRGGELQDDVVDAFVRRSRVPLLVNLDLRAKIAANQVGITRVERLIERYGPTVVKSVMKRMMNDAEQRLRDRLSAIPDGSWSATEFMEQSSIGDRGMHKIALTMTKTGDHMTFDFRGTDPQTGMINCPWSGMRAGITVAMLPVLAGDIPWSAGGLMRCFDIISDEGTINNATFPAAVGWAPLTAAWATSNLVAECFGKMLDTSEDLRQRTQCGCTGSFDIVTLAGLDQHGTPSVMILLDAMAGGYGARPDRDGGDTAGILPIPMGRCPDAEMQEFLYPVLFLWRREEIDSGGAGLNRGGVSISMCLLPHNTPMPLAGAFSGNGKARPEVNGLAGGYPGGSAFDLIIRGADARAMLDEGRMPTTLDDFTGDRDVVGNRTETMIGLTDVVFVHPSGGGGYGDPIQRPSAKVANDVKNGKVSSGAAHDAYGVVLTASLDVDEERTTERRAAIRRHRVGSEVAVPNPAVVLDADVIDANLQVLGGGAQVTCRHCGHEFGLPQDDYLSGAHRHVGELTDAGATVSIQPEHYVDHPMVFSQLCCPTCATALLTEVMPATADTLAGT